MAEIPALNSSVVQSINIREETKLMLYTLMLAMVLVGSLVVMVAVKTKDQIRKEKILQPGGALWVAGGFISLFADRPPEMAGWIRTASAAFPFFMFLGVGIIPLPRRKWTGSRATWMTIVVAREWCVVSLASLLAGSALIIHDLDARTSDLTPLWHGVLVLVGLFGLAGYSTFQPGRPELNHGTISDNDDALPPG